MESSTSSEPSEHSAAGAWFAKALTGVMTSKAVRKTLLKQVDKRIYKEYVEKNTKFPKAVQLRKYEVFSAMLHTYVRNLDRGFVSDKNMKHVVESLIMGALFHKGASAKAREEFKAQHNGTGPASFIVLSPSQRCNLHCIGCYANSGVETTATLPFDVVDRIVDEAYHKWGNRFMTISGGEPLLYRSDGKSLFDIFAKYPSMYFLMYTNGTLMTPQVAQRLASLGNVTPAISVEGFEEQTDARRGKGIHKQILTAFANLREAGVPFGISVTATSVNAPVLLTDEFYDFYFEQQGATYMWQFQLMPIGRAVATENLMLTPQQRLALYKRWRTLLAEKKYMIADFWNSGMISNGCIAYGREGGYLYIDWNGNIMPCVFVPYYVDNVYDLFKEGKSLTDALFSEFFENGRKWQQEYGLNDPHKPGNWLMPCSIRDHHKNFREHIINFGVKAENKEAEAALSDPKYHQMMDRFDQELHELTDHIWEEEYLEK